MSEKEKDRPVCRAHNEKMRAFYSPHDPDYDEFIKHLSENGKEIVGFFKKVKDPMPMTLRVHYFDIEGEKTYPIVKVEFSWG